MILDSEEQSFKIKNKGEDEDESLYLKGIIKDLEFQLAERNLGNTDATSEHVLLDKAGYLTYKLLPYTKLVGAKAEKTKADSILMYNLKSDSPEPIENRSKIVQTLGIKSL